MEVDSVSGLTVDAKYQNFEKIMTIAQHFENGGSLTTDMKTEGKELILQYRHWIPDFSMINDEITEPEFRKCCAETETLISHLTHGIMTHGTFNERIYMLFMAHMKQILKTVFTEDELADLLSGLSM
jgi:hypothetical protein